LLSKSPVKPYSTSIFMGKTHNFYHQNTIFDALPTSRTSAGACGRRAGATPWRPGVRVWDKNRRVLNLRIKIGEKSGLFHNLYRDFFTSFTKKKWLNRIEGSKFLWVLPDKKKLISAEMNEPVLPWPQGSRLPRSVRPDNGMLVVEDKSPSSENSDFFLTVSCI
jgi:hypothetical protein